MHKAASCIHQKNSVDSLHKYNGPIEEVAMLVDLSHLLEEFPKVARATLGRSWWKAPCCLPSCKYLLSCPSNACFQEYYLTLSRLLPSVNPVPNAQVCVYLTVHITKPDMKYKFFKQLSILMVTHWKSNVEIWQSFTIFSPHFWLLKPSKIASFLNFRIFHFTFQRNFSGKNNGIKGLSGRICHRGPNPEH
jgi:hypothetical protein